MIVKHASVTPLSSRSCWKIMPTNTRSSVEWTNAHAAATRVPLMLLHFCLTLCVCFLYVFFCFFFFVVFGSFFICWVVVFGNQLCFVFFFAFLFERVSCFGAAYPFFHVLQYTSVFYNSFQCHQFVLVIASRATDIHTDKQTYINIHTNIQIYNQLYI